MAVRAAAAARGRHSESGCGAAVTVAGGHRCRGPRRVLTGRLTSVPPPASLSGSLSRYSGKPLPVT
eukprot:96940-Rhodomonas_salina.1